MSDPTDLVAWLNACYDRAEQRARALLYEAPEVTATLGPVDPATGAPSWTQMLERDPGRWQAAAQEWAAATEAKVITPARSVGIGVSSWLTSDVNALALAQHIADLDPSWRLAEIARHRAILAIHRTEPDDDKRHWRMPVRACVGCGWDQYEEAAVEDINGCPVVRLLAEEFDREPGYREEWRP